MFSTKDMIVLVCPEIYQMEAGANDQVKRYSDICHSTSNPEKANQQYASVQECRRTSARPDDTDTCCHPCTYASLTVGREGCEFTAVTQPLLHVGGGRWYHVIIPAHCFTDAN
jgi:hypothetical protein